MADATDTGASRLFPDINRVCSIDGCDDPIKTKGYCSKHYQRLRLYGDPCATPIRYVRANKRKEEKASRFLEWKGQMSRATTKQERTCFVCEAVFYRGQRGVDTKRDAGKCCSRECGWKWQSIKKAAIRPVSFTLRKAICGGCNAWFIPVGTAKYCSTGCKPVLGYRQRTVECRVCTAPFEAKPYNTKYCSDECRSVWDKRQRDASRSKHKAWAIASGSKASARKARKLRLRGVTVEPVNLIKVLDRDKWKCQLCGISTPRKLRGTYDDRAPEVDHIIPIAAGGEHSYANTQCACRKCNSAKSGAPLGQMRLF